MSTPTSVPHWLVPAIKLIQQHVKAEQALKPAVVVQLSPEPAKVKKAVRRRIVESESEEEENDNNNLLDLFDSAGKLTEESDTKVDESEEATSRKPQPGLHMLAKLAVEQGGGGSAAGASASSKDKKSDTANTDVSKNDSPSKNTRDARDSVHGTKKKIKIANDFMCLYLCCVQEKISFGRPRHITLTLQ